MMSYFSPKPKQKPKRLPRRRPIKAIPSGIGDKGLVGNWLFYYLKGGDHLHDFSPYDNHGTINGAKWVDGRYGWALDFDGVDDYVRISDAPEFDFQTFTTSLWVKPQSSGGFHNFICRDSGDTPNRHWFIQKMYDDVMRIWVFDESNNVYQYTTTKTVTIGEWYHFTLTYDGSYLRFYWNGDRVINDALSITVNEGTQPISIGRRSDDTYYADAVMDDVRIYDRALSAQEIQAYYNRTKGIFR